MMSPAMTHREPSFLSPVNADLAKLHQAERRYWIARCFWITAGAVSLVATVTWLVIR